MSPFAQVTDIISDRLTTRRLLIMRSANNLFRSLIRGFSSLSKTLFITKILPTWSHRASKCPPLDGCPEYYFTIISLSKIYYSNVEYSIFGKTRRKSMYLNLQNNRASTKYSRKMISEYVSTSDEHTQIVWKLFPCLHFPKCINRATILISALPGWCISSLCASELHVLGQLPFKRRRRSTLLHEWYVSSSL